jgi:hypothetical protein
MDIAVGFTLHKAPQKQPVENLFLRVVKKITGSKERVERNLKKEMTLKR